MLYKDYWCWKPFTNRSLLFIHPFVHKVKGSYASNKYFAAAMACFVLFCHHPLFCCCCSLHSVGFLVILVYLYFPGLFWQSSFLVCFTSWCFPSFVIICPTMIVFPCVSSPFVFLTHVFLFVSLSAQLFGDVPVLFPVLTFFSFELYS